MPPCGLYMLRPQAACHGAAPRALDGGRALFGKEFIVFMV